MRVTFPSPPGGQTRPPVTSAPGTKLLLKAVLDRRDSDASQDETSDDDRGREKNSPAVAEEAEQEDPRLPASQTGLGGSAQLSRVFLHFVRFQG